LRDDLGIDSDREGIEAADPGKDLGRSVPLGPPCDWEVGGDGDLVYWAFLDSICTHHPIRPWLIVEEAESAIGPVRFCLPRLAPECRWADRESYEAWERASWEGATEPIAAVLELEEAVAALPDSPTRPRWADRERLLALVLRADIGGRTTSEILAENGEADLAGDPARTLRRQIRRGRDLMAALGVLPWAALDLNADPRLRSDWWRRPGFAEALLRWRADATDLSWRAARGCPPAPDPDRDAASLVRRSLWVGADPRALALARSRLRASARLSGGDVENWLKGLIAYPHQSEECRADLVYRADAEGSAAELRAIWAEVHERTLPG
jgi:hypothetical protein